MASRDSVVESVFGNAYPPLSEILCTHKFLNHVLAVGRIDWCTVGSSSPTDVDGEVSNYLFILKKHFHHQITITFY